MVLSARSVSLPPQAYRAEAEKPLLDLAFLARQTMGDEALDQELLLLFRRQAQQFLRALGTVDDRSGLALGSLAHALKGAALAVGAEAVAETADRFGQMGQGGDDTRATKAHLIETLTATIAAIDQVLDESAAHS